MPSGNLTALDLIRHENTLAFPLIEENKQLNPELDVLTGETMEGTSMELSVRTDLPTVGFRNLNEGTTRSKSGTVERIFQTHILDAQIAFDTQLAAGRRLEVVQENEAAGFVESSLRTIGSQTWYGVTSDAKGFPGIIAQMDADTDHEVNASGSSNKSSVFFVRIGRETIQYLFGLGTTINLKDEWMIETLYDSNSKPYQAYTNWLTGRIGLRVANRNAVVRIKNLAASSQTLTDALMSQAYRKFTEFGHEPTHIFMNGRSLEQLQTSRTATTTDGRPAPMPKDWEGIPIIRTSNITNAETI